MEEKGKRREKEREGCEWVTKWEKKKKRPLRFDFWNGWWRLKKKKMARISSQIWV